MKTNLANILKPTKINEFVGQKHLLNKDCLIRRMIEKQTMFSMIFFGLPGTGKTSLANIICNELKINFNSFNPTKQTKKELDEILKKHILNDDKPYVLIIDEIHRMNRDKQDILLSYLEKDNFFIIGTTTENPYFVINPAIRSRCQIVQFKPFDEEDVFNYLKQVCKKISLDIDEEAINFLAKQNFSDLRSSLNSLDLVNKLYKDEKITIDLLKKVLLSPIAVGSSYGNEFYDLQSAFHKSLRGSDIDASIYYLARLIKIGDLQSITRRMIAMAYEDIGLANPQLVSRVIMGINSAERLGFPEANQILSSLVIEMCLSPKSNSAYLAISKALNDIENGLGNFDIPNHLKDTHYKSSVKLGYGGYKYPHNYPNNWVEQNYLPKEIINKIYYVCQQNNIEMKMNEQHNERTKHGNKRN